MSIPVTCRCGKSFRVKNEYAGKKGKCPACGVTLVVPDHTDVAAQPPKTQVTTKRRLCSKCGGIVEPEAAIVDEGGRVICPHCFGGNRLDESVSTKSNKRMLFRLTILGSVLIVALTAKWLTIRSGSAPTDPESRTADKTIEKDRPARPIADMVQPDEATPQSQAVVWAKRVGRTRDVQEIMALRNATTGPGNKAYMDALTAFHDAVEKKTNEKTSSVSMVLFFDTFDPVWKSDNTFSVERSTFYVRRIQGLPPAAIDQWRLELSKKTDEELRKDTIIGHLIQMDSPPFEAIQLFQNEQFLQAASDRLIDRLRNTPPDAITTLANALGAKKPAATIELICNDWLYDQSNNFKDAAFRQGMAELLKAGQPMLARQRPAKSQPSSPPDAGSPDKTSRTGSDGTEPDQGASGIVKAYLDVIMEQIVSDLRAAGTGGRPLTQNKEITTNEHIFEVKRAFQYHSDGYATVTENTTAKSAKTGTVMATFQLAWRLDSQGRTLSIIGDAKLPTGRSVGIGRFVHYTADGNIHFSDK